MRSLSGKQGERENIRPRKCEERWHYKKEFSLFNIIIIKKKKPCSRIHVKSTVIQNEDEPFP